MATIITLIEGPRQSGKTFLLHALSTAALAAGRSIFALDEPEVKLFLEDPKTRMTRFRGRRFDDVFLVGPDVVKAMTHLTVGQIITFPFSVRFINLNITEINASDYATIK